MNILSSKPLPRRGVTRVVIDLAPGEKLVAIQSGTHYKLGYPLDDEVIHSDQLAAAVPVTWCVVAQGWKE